MKLNQLIEKLIRSYGLENELLAKILRSVESHREVVEHMSDRWLDHWYEDVCKRLDQLGMEEE